MNEIELRKLAQQSVYSPKALKFGKTLKNKIHKTSVREHLSQKYGSNAFLRPEQKKFPIVNPNTGKISCKLLKAAKMRAAQHGYSDVVNKASTLMTQHKCISGSLQKTAVLAESLLAAGLGHLAQNQSLKYMVNKEDMLPKLIEGRLTKAPTAINQTRKGLANAALPELGIAESEARHSFKDISQNMGYRDKVHAVNALKGNWTKMSKSEEGRKALVKHLSKKLPMVGSVIHRLPEETIAELEKVYKGDKFGKNIINTTNRLSRHKQIVNPTGKQKAISGAAEIGGNIGMAFKEPLFSTLNGLKRAGAADLSKFENVKNKPGKAAYKIVKGTQNGLKNLFVKNPLETTAMRTLGNDSYAKAADSAKRIFHTEAGNALAGKARELDNKLMGVIKKRHPIMAEGMRTKLQERASKRGIRGLVNRVKQKIKNRKQLG